MSLMACNNCHGSFTLDDIPTDGSAFVCPHCGQHPFQVTVTAVFSGSIGGTVSTVDPTATVAQEPPPKPKPTQNPFYKHTRNW